MEQFIPAHGVAFWLWNIFAVVIIWTTASNLIKGKQAPLKADYMKALGITPEEADILFKPTTDRLYKILRRIGEMTLPIAAILFLIVTYMPGASGQVWLGYSYQISVILAMTSFLLIAIFRGRTSAKVSRLSNVDNFRPDPVTGELPKTSNIYAHDILIYRIGACVILFGMWSKLHDWAMSLISS